MSLQLRTVCLTQTSDVFKAARISIVSDVRESVRKMSACGQLGTACRAVPKMGAGADHRLFDQESAQRMRGAHVLEQSTEVEDEPSSVCVPCLRLGRLGALTTLTRQTIRCNSHEGSSD